ncbi:Vacuolar protein sorting-associated protein 53 A [Vitis vinifera]|uniref:Vacuolar protein sorting-associated protein 53 A n=1 Tax=Vitis vinifera TaxID=29760 RepID=A0A438JWR2_VITVI|nr:Vacuolar protein sorting-associated protein 53 A [Vitis vinifera]
MSHSLRTLHSSHPPNLFPFLKYCHFPIYPPPSDALSRPLQVYHRRHRAVAPPLSSAEVLDDSPPVPPISLTLTLSSTDHLPIALRKGNRSIRNPHPIFNFLSYHRLSSSYSAFVSTLSSVSFPKSTSEALSHLGWQQAMVDEMAALHSNGTWDLVSLPLGKSTVGCRWVYIVKVGPDGQVDRLKARLVAKGYTQIYGCDYGDTFSPVAKIASVHLFLSMAAIYHWPLYQLDIKNAFLHGELLEEVYMEQPPGFVAQGESSLVCKLRCSLYGLKQSPRAWFGRFSSVVQEFGMLRSEADHSVFYHHNSSSQCIYLVVYVDDIVITGTQSSSGVVMSQRKYALDILEETGMLECKPVDTPMDPNVKLVPGKGEPLRDPGRYRQLVGKLNYLTITRPNISFPEHQAKVCCMKTGAIPKLLVTQMQTELVHPQIGVPPQGIVFLLEALQRTLEFEEELAEKFGGDTRRKDIGNDIEEVDRGENKSQTVSDIRKKYEKKLAANQGSGTEEKDGNKDLSVPGAGFNFRGIISSCFEPHLTVYVELEEKTLMENLEKLVQEETWDIEEGSQTNVLSSSVQVFLIIRRSLKRCSALTKNQTLFNLFKVILHMDKKDRGLAWSSLWKSRFANQGAHRLAKRGPSSLVDFVGHLLAPCVFQRILKAYATKLFARLPKGGTGIVAAATGMDGQIKTSDRDERVICYIVNTAEYCHKTFVSGSSIEGNLILQQVIQIPVSSKNGSSSTDAILCPFNACEVGVGKGSGVSVKISRKGSRKSGYFPLKGYLEPLKKRLLTTFSFIAPELETYGVLCLGSMGDALMDCYPYWASFSMCSKEEGQLDAVDMSEVQDEFSAVITKALITLVHGLETKFDAEMAAMTRVPWGTLESVGDQSEYVNAINLILTSSIPALGSLLSPIYFQFFLDKVIIKRIIYSFFMLPSIDIGVFRFINNASGSPVCLWSIEYANFLITLCSLHHLLVHASTSTFSNASKYQKLEPNK